MVNVSLVEDSDFSEEVDVVVVGAGAGGMVAALAAQDAGLNVLLIEKSQYFGGSSALSGGGCWVPNAPLLLREGVRDDPADTLTYLRAITKGKVPEDRLKAYVEQAPKMMEFLERQGTHLKNGFFWIRGYSDYYPNEPGAQPDGRGLWPAPIDRRLLGDDRALLRAPNKRLQLPLGSWLTSSDLRDLLALRWRRFRGKSILLRLGWRIVRARVLGERIGTSGQALVTRLWLTLREHGVPVRLETPLRSLTQDANGDVNGVEVESEGRTVRIRARHGVILASGGFDHNMEMRHRYQPEIQGEWSSGSVDNQGDGIWAAEEIGASLDLMDDAWWSPSVKFSDGSIFTLVPERQYPGQFIVNHAGKRFVNEAAPYTDFVHAQIEGEQAGVGHIPCWYIIDDRAWKRNLIAGHLPGAPMPKHWVDDGVAFQADSLSALAERIGVPPEALTATAARYNEMVRKGRDEDFHRGESPYERFYGDPSYANPNLAPIDQAPFYAIAFVPGDLGTKGGLVTDEFGRVLRADHTPIPGLYATGNATATVMGNSYAGPGATLGPALTFGYVAASHIAASRARDESDREGAVETRR